MSVAQSPKSGPTLLNLSVPLSPQSGNGSLLGCSVHGRFQARILCVLPFSPGDSPDPRIQPVSPALAAGFFDTGATGKLM